jgi:hypothetical protein
MLRPLVYILVVAVIFTPLLASANIMLLRRFPETAYLVSLVVAASALSVAAFAKKRIALPKIGLLGIAVLLWAAVSVAVSRDFLPLAFAALFIILQALMLYEEEWIRLLRIFVWVGVLLTWPAFLGQAGRVFLGMYAPFFVPMTFVALAFSVRDRTRVSRLWFGGAAILFSLVLLDAYAGAPGSFQFWRALWMARGSWELGSPGRMAIAAALGLVWIAAFWTVGKIARRKAATPIWIAGLSGAFAGQLLADPFLSAWPPGSTLAFVLVAALAEWVAHAAKP